MAGKAISIDEQETVIQISRSDDKCRVYSSDTRMRNRLSKLYADKLARVYRQDGEPVAEEYEIDRRLLSFRKMLPKRREISEDERQELRERMLALREAQGM